MYRLVPALLEQTRREGTTAIESTVVLRTSTALLPPKEGPIAGAGASISQEHCGRRWRLWIDSRGDFEAIVQHWDRYQRHSLRRSARMNI